MKWAIFVLNRVWVWRPRWHSSTQTSLDCSPGQQNWSAVSNVYVGLTVLSPFLDIGKIRFHKWQAKIYLNILFTPSLRKYQNCMFWIPLTSIPSKLVSKGAHIINRSCFYLFGRISSIFQQNDYEKTILVLTNCYAHYNIVIYPLNVEWVKFLLSRLVSVKSLLNDIIYETRAWD